MTRTGNALLVLGVFFALARAAPARAAEPVEYYAEVDREKIGLDDTVTLTVTLAVSGKEPDSVEPPGTGDFETVSQSTSHQTSMTMGGGGTSVKRIRTTTSILRPLRQGRLVIEPGTAVVDGRKTRTGRLTVEVGPPGSGAPPPTARRAPGSRSMRPPGFPTPPGFDDQFDSMLGGSRPVQEGDLFLRASLDKDSAYIGEQVTLSIHLYARVDISGVEGLKMPSLDGFWAEDVETPNQISGTVREVDGVPYRVFPIRRRALFPLAAGTATIDPVELDISTGLSVFGGGRKVHRKSQTLALEVRPLPVGAPAGFSPGNVGDWSLAVAADRAETTVGTPVTVKVTARGRGNLRNLEPPPLPKLDGFKVFDPTRTESGGVEAGRFGGEKVLEYVLVPEREGTTTVPPLRLALFDPSQGAYREVASEPLTITVLPGTDAGAVARAVPPAAAGAGLRELRSVPRVAAARVPLYDRPWFYALLALPAVVALGIAVAPRVATLRARGEGGRKVRRAGAAARRRLAGARSLAVKRERGFFAELDRALHEYLSTKLGRPTAGLTRENLAATLQAAGAPAVAIASLTRTLDACDVGRFAPGAVDGARVDAALAAAGAVLDALESANLRRES